MIRTTIALSILAISAAATAAADSIYLRGEQFNESPVNWRQTRPDQFFGFERTRITGGRGAAGGLLLPTTFFNFYGDVFLNGIFAATDAVAARGRIVLPEASRQPGYVGTSYVGHFRRDPQPFINVVGLAITGQGGANVTVEAILQFADGRAYVGDPIEIPLSTRILDWSIAWDPNGGATRSGRLVIRVGGGTSTISLKPGTRGDLALDAFGIFQPPFNNPDSNSFLRLYIGDLSYTAFRGIRPVLIVRAPRTIKIRRSILTVRGFARVLPGNSVVRVRYRLVHRDGRGRFRTADGTSGWKARLRVPRGNSRLEILARSDDGQISTAHRMIRSLR